MEIIIGPFLTMTDMFVFLNKYTNNKKNKTNTRPSASSSISRLLGETTFNILKVYNNFNMYTRIRPGLILCYRTTHTLKGLVRLQTVINLWQLSGMNGSHRGWTQVNYPATNTGCVFLCVLLLVLMSVFKGDQKVRSPNMFSSNPILRKPFQNDQQSVNILCFWCLMIASRYVSTLIKADDAATRKKTAPELL